MQDQIVMLRGPERVRRRPAVVFGSDDIHGAEMALQMLLDTLAGEGIAGHCNQITVTQYLDDSLTIQDNGRGIFFGEDDTWQELFCQLFASPLYQNDRAARSIFEPPSGKEGEYTESLTLCSVQYASEYMDVCVIRDGFQQTLHFEKGHPVDGLRRTPSPEPTGTCIRFKPDPEVFSEISLPAQGITDMLQGLALQIPGMKAIFRRERKNGFAETEFCYPQGIADFLQQQNGCVPVYTAALSAEGQERYNHPRYTASVQVGICFARDAGFVKCYHNLAELTYGGTHRDEAIKEIGNYLRWVQEREISEADLQKHLQLVILTNSEITAWVNGAKNSIENILIRDLIQDAIADDFHYYVKVNREALDNLFRE